MLISIDQNDPRPIYQQIAAAIKQQLCSGLLEPGDELPSVRDMADALAVNLHTVRHAYKLLREQGVVRLGLARRAKILAPPKQPPNQKQLEQTLLPRLRELVADAGRLGVGDDDLRQLMDHAIIATRKRRSKK
ncbi:MAG: GntR family transcriptional regulator [Planctomycetaceae bacterium]|nr:MAG: GntR family transcriptional regulator [Planctomycetaceae bacterium]